MDLSVYWDIYEIVAFEEEESVLKYSEDNVEIGIRLVSAYLCI